MFVVSNIFAQDCINETVRGFTPNYQFQVEVCIEEACGFGTDFHISKVKLTFPASTAIYNTQCFSYHSLPGFSGEDSGIATVCNDTNECSEVPVSFIVGVAPNCLPDTIEVDVETSGTITEVCLEEYCSDLGALNFTLLNPPSWTYDPMGKGEGLCVEHYSLPGSGIYKEIYQAQICNDDSNTYCDTVTFVFNVGNPTAIEGFEEDNLIEVYPNPTSEVLYFSSPKTKGKVSDFEAALYNLRGQKVLQYSFDGLEQKDSYSMNVADMPTGVYFLSLQSSKGKALGNSKGHRIVIK